LGIVSPIVEPSGKRAAAIDEDRWHIAADHGHHHAGKRLVAAAEADQRIIGQAVDHGFDRIGDQLARDQREFHPLVIHADTVGNRNGGEFPRRATGFCDPGLSGIDLEIVGHVAGRLLALHADYPDHGLGQRLVVQSHRTHESAVGRAIKTIDRHARSPLLHASFLRMSSWRSPGRR
jgi:hypothetical protein